MSGTIPAFTIVTANGSQIPGGFDLATATQVARETEIGGGLSVVKIMQGATVVLEGDELRRALG